MSDVTTQPTHRLREGLRVLAIGNSFAVNNSKYIPKIAHDLGVQDITVGVIYRGGCSLRQHIDFAHSEEAAYWYYETVNTSAAGEGAGYEFLTDEAKEVSGDFTCEKDVSFEDCIRRHDWDIITFQQRSDDSGRPAPYDDLGELAEIVRGYCPRAEFLWNMTWTYAGYCPYEGFDNYQKDQETMQQAILTAVRDKICPQSYIRDIIPCGNLIHRLRALYGDVFQVSDGVHLNTAGEFATGVLWCHVLLHTPVDRLTFRPDGVSEEMAEQIKRLVPLVAADPVNGGLL